MRKLTESLRTCPPVKWFLALSSIIALTASGADSEDVLEKLASAAFAAPALRVDAQFNWSFTENGLSQVTSMHWIEPSGNSKKSADEFKTLVARALKKKIDTTNFPLVGPSPDCVLLYSATDDALLCVSLVKDREKPKFIQISYPEVCLSSKSRVYQDRRLPNGDIAVIFCGTEVDAVSLARLFEQFSKANRDPK